MIDLEAHAAYFTMANKVAAIENAREVLSVVPAVRHQEEWGGDFINIKTKIHSSCEIEDFVEIHLCKLCAILRSRVLLGVCLH